MLFRWECEHWNARKVRPADWMGIMSTTVTVWWATKIIPKNKTAAPRKMNLTTLFPPCVPATFSGKIWTNSSGVAKSDTLRLVSTEWIHFYASGKVTEFTIISNRGTNSFFHLFCFNIMNIHSYNNWQRQLGHRIGVTFFSTFFFSFHEFLSAALTSPFFFCVLKV